MTATMPNPFDFGFVDVVMPSTEKAAASPMPPRVGDAAANLYPRGFDCVQFLGAIEDRCWQCGSQGASCYCNNPACPFDGPMPVFLSDPSEEFIAAMHRDVLPLLED